MTDLEKKHTSQSVYDGYRFYCIFSLRHLVLLYKSTMKIMITEFLNHLYRSRCAAHTILLIRCRPLFLTGV